MRIVNMSNLLLFKRKEVFAMAKKGKGGGGKKC